LVAVYVGLCSVFNLLAARAMHFDELGIRAQDLLCFIQLPGLVLSGSALFVAALRNKRGKLWDVTAVLTIVASVVGLMVTIFGVCLGDLPSPFHRFTPGQALLLRRRITFVHPSLFPHVDAFATFALVALDCWFCLAWTFILNASRGAKGES
jgi:hypothetical protein